MCRAGSRGGREPGRADVGCGEWHFGWSLGDEQDSHRWDWTGKDGSGTGEGLEVCNCTERAENRGRVSAPTATQDANG